jgi:lipopolysaccharide export system permease protein
MTLWRYLLAGFLRSVIGVFAVIALVVMLFTTVENTRRYGDTEAQLGDVLQISALQLPEVLYQIFPLVLMLGSLVTFLRLARTSELVVIRAAGISALRLIGVPVAASVVLGIGFVLAVNPFVAATMKKSEILDESFSETPSSLSVSPEGIWLRQADPAGGQTVVQAARADATGTLLRQVRLHRFDENGTLYMRIDAPSARLISGAWLLANANVWELDTATGRFERRILRGRLDLQTSLTRQQIQESFSPPETIGIWQLRGFIARIEQSGLSGTRHRLYLQSEVARPALFAAMVLVGAAFALRPARFGQTGVMILLAIMAGFSLYFLKDFAESLGAQGRIPLTVAAWTPPVATIFLAVGLLLHLEDG